MEKSLTNVNLFRNIHKGKRAIVCGSGYSINNINWDNLPNDDIIFSCNQSITSLNHCNYFCMTDGSIVEASFFEYGISISDNIMFCSGNSFIVFQPVINIYEKIKNKSYFLNRRYKSPSDLNFDLDDGLLITGKDVVHVVSHLAYIMGCCPIVLIGVDLNYNNGKKYCDSIKYGKEVIWGDQYKVNPIGDTDNILLDSFQTWISIKTQNPNIKFQNANPNGKLSDIFETINLNLTIN